MGQFVREIRICFLVKRENLMKKFLSSIMAVVTLLFVTLPAYASEATVPILEQNSVSEALSDSEIVDYLVSCDAPDELDQAQEEIRNTQYAAVYAQEASEDTEISEADVDRLTQEYGLTPPNENAKNPIDGKINSKQYLRGSIIDIWYSYYIYYIVLPEAFFIKAVWMDAGDRLDAVSGLIIQYYLNSTVRRQRDHESVGGTAAADEGVYIWDVGVSIKSPSMTPRR